MNTNPEQGPMSEAATELDKDIDRERDDIKTEKLDLSFGELDRMYTDGDLIIQPEYQRLFRWSSSQKFRFIESILLGIPFPAIFVSETDDGVWELVDGLQRLSTVLELFGSLEIDGEIQSPLELESGSRYDILTSMDGFKYEEFTHRTRRALKRAYCRVEVIKRDSVEQMKFEVFHRLNTGGSILSEQEIRNCIFRSMDSEFMDFIDEVASLDCFRNVISPTQKQVDEMYDRGLALRFFAFYDRHGQFKHDVEPFITDYAREVVSGDVEFNMDQMRELFKRTFELIDEASGDDAFKYIRDGEAKGATSVYLFDSISIAVANHIDKMEDLGKEQLFERIRMLKNDEDFDAHTGSGKNSARHLHARLRIASSIIGDE